MSDILFKSVVGRDDTRVIVEDSHPFYEDEGVDIIGVKKMDDSDVIALFLSKVERKDLLRIAKDWVSKRDTFATPQDELTASKLSKTFNMPISSSDVLNIH